MTKPRDYGSIKKVFWDLPCIICYALILAEKSFSLKKYPNFENLTVFRNFCSLKYPAKSEAGRLIEGTDFVSQLVSPYFLMKKPTHVKCTIFEFLETF